MSVGTPELLGEAEAAAEAGLELSGADITARSPLELFWRRFRADRIALVALAFIAVVLIVAIFAPLIVKLVGAPGPNVQSYKALDRFGSPTGPSSHHIFGVDGLGRDVFARVLYGARVSLEVALIATTISVTLGVVAGMYAGFYRGWIDTLISRVIDVQLAFPILLLAVGLGASCSLGNGCLKEHGLGGFLIYAALALALINAFRLARRMRRLGVRALERSSMLAPFVLPGLLLLLGVVLRFAVSGNSGLIRPGLTTVIFVIAFANWTYIARIIRGQVLSLREKEFVEASRSLGASNARIIFREILPNLVAPIIVYSSLVIPQNILFEAALSFLGVGVQPPQASWGAMIADATNIFDTAWWYMTFPGLALLFSVLAFNLLGDGLLDALNPRSGR